MSTPLPAALMAETRTQSGGGRTNPITAQVVQPSSVGQLQELVRGAPPCSLIARGLGRSYGNAAQLKHGTGIELPAFDRIELDPANGTVGGAIAADGHGKNHHVDGSFGNHVQRLLLVDVTGTLWELTPNGRDSFEEAEFFWATVGGMGLTGVIVEATFSLIPITSSLISVDTTRYREMESLMAAMVEADAKYRYSMAWVDSLDPKSRGVLPCGDHAPAEALPKAQQPDPLHDDPKALASAPPFLPGGLPNKLTVRVFVEAWYRKAPKRRVGELQATAPFFHPLDGVQDWNRIYGPAGFLQYQFAVPNEAAHWVPRTLEALRKVGAPSFLTVLKRFGPSNPAPLSFPIPCWTLAADVPAAVPGLLGVLNQLDEEVAATGGRLYVAKGSSQAEGLIKKTYHRISEWMRCEGFLDPEATLTSSLSQRLGIGSNAGSG